MLMAQKTGAWTLAELDRLPDDGNRYEVVDGELFVTPVPSPAHELLALELHSFIDPYVRAERVGRAFMANSAIRAAGSELVPDLTVRKATPIPPPAKWEQMPIPFLVVEVISPSTWRRDHEQKRAFYLRNGVAEYWIVDGQERTIRVVTSAADDTVATHQLLWHPSGASTALVIDVQAYFRAVLG